MNDKPVILAVGTQCAPELEEKFNNWYNGTHVPMLLESKWLDVVTRYKLAPIAQDKLAPATQDRLAPITQAEYPKYLAIYEFKNRQAFEAWTSCPEFIAAIKETGETWAEDRFELKWMVLYEPMKTWHK